MSEEASWYEKRVSWSDEDGCFVGQCPALFLGGVHGDDEAAVYAELCQVVDGHCAMLATDGASDPPPRRTGVERRPAPDPGPAYCRQHHSIPDALIPRCCRHLTVDIRT